MRITQQSLHNTWNRDVQARLQEIDRLNRQIGSGVRVQKPADDPTGASRIVRIQEVAARTDQYLRNIDEALAVNRATDAALEQVHTQLVRAKQLALEGSSEATMTEAGSFSALAGEVAGIRDAVVQLAGSVYQEKYLFAGTSGAGAPFAETGGAYRGDSNTLRVNVGEEQSVPVNLPGDIAFRETRVRSAQALPDGLTLDRDLVFDVSDGTTTVTVTLLQDRDLDAVPDTYAPLTVASEIDRQLQAAGLNAEARVASDGTLELVVADTAQGGELTVTDPSGDLEGILGVAPGTKNVVELLADLEAAFLSGSTQEVHGLLGRIDRALDDLVTQRGLVGSRARNLEYARTRLEANKLAYEALRGEIETVDLTEAVMKVSAEQQAYQAALASGARVFGVSILDFLR
ncbi:MAG: flagellar hook-associated protein FlgL [Deferrisomatales bacterium]